jgi:hypothetical protein
MPFVAALALALLQALTVFSPLAPRQEGVARERPAAERLAFGDRRIAAVSARLPEKALPAARTLGTPLLPRLASRTPLFDGPPTAALVAPPSRLASALTAPSRLRFGSVAAHVVAARGSLLPYFPTAPPLQG